MSKAKKKSNNTSGTIALNKRARHDFFIEQKFEAGIALTGWEVKSLRAGKAQLVDSHVFLRDGEAWLLNTLITPLMEASTHVVCEPTRDRKLLLHKREIDKLTQVTEQKGKACVATALYWKGNHIKVEIALATGKSNVDKRDTQRDRDWARDKERVMKSKNL